MNNAMSRVDKFCLRCPPTNPPTPPSEKDSDLLFFHMPEQPASSIAQRADLGRALHSERDSRPKPSSAHEETGSVFLKLAEESSPKEAANPVGTNGIKEIILVVDDEPAILAVMKIALVKSGFQVLVANNGAEALETFELMRGQIKVLITDMAMPGMNGLELIRLIREFNDSVEIVATTGMTTMDQMQAIRDADVQHVLSKPCGSRQLIALVRNLFSLP